MFSDRYTCCKEIDQFFSQEMITSADLNRDGTVDFKEFVVMMADKMQPSTTLEAEIREAFKVFDKNKDG